MLKLFDPRWLAIVMLLSVAALPIRTQASTPTVVFSEIAWAGSSISSSDEWIELTNVSDETINVSGWTLTGAGSSSAVLTLPEDSLVEPHSTYLIANYEHAHENTALEAEPDFVISSLSLSNDGFSLTLSDALGTLIDVAGGTGAPFAGGSGGTGDSVDGRYRSMVRGDGIGDGALPESWADADSSQGFLEGVSDLGTPGMVVFATVEQEVVEETIEEEAVEDSVVDEIVEEIVSEESSVEEVIPEESAEEGAEEVAVVPEEIVEEVVEEVIIEEQTEAAPSTETIVSILISEFMVDPIEDGVEWVELYNAGDTSVTLEGWSIEDASGGSTDLSSITIESDRYAVIESPKGKLNNDGDTVVLKDANGSIVESVTYGGEGYPIPKDGEALAHNGETFEITELPTPGSANLIFVAVGEVEETDEVETVEEEIAEESLVEESQVEETTEEIAIMKTLRFVTLYPNTTGSDEAEEYIELQNTGAQTINLQGWSIEDGSTDRYTIEDSTLLNAGATIRLMRPETKITLNNGGDTLELIAPDEEVIDKVTYGNAAKGATYAFVNDTWNWSGTATVAESTTATTTSTATSTSSTSNTTNATYTSSTTSSRVAQSVTVAQAKEKTDGQQVTIRGVVTASPGMFGTQIFYLQDETGGIQIYLYSSDFPELVVGDVVQITGELSTSRGERRVKLAEAAGVVTANGSFFTGAQEASLGDIDETLVGSLIATQGQVQSKEATKLVIETSGATLTIYLKSNPMIDPNQFERGDKIEVTGVLTTYDGELRLRPRSTDDITVVEQAPVATAAVSEPGGGSNAGLILLFSTMAALGALALWRYMPRRRLTPVNA